MKGSQLKYAAKVGRGTAAEIRPRKHPMANQSGPAVALGDPKELELWLAY